jgi:hypothetical protein
VSTTQPTWIYRADGAAKIVEHPIGAAAPDGWSFDPNEIEDASKRTSDALSGVKPIAAYGADLDKPTDAAGTPDTAGVIDDSAERMMRELEAALVRVSELEGIILVGTAENAEILADLSTAETDLARVLTDLEATGPALTDATARGDRLETALKASTDELARARDANAPLNATIAKLEATIGDMQAEIDRLRIKKNGTR